MEFIKRQRKAHRCAWDDGIEEERTKIYTQQNDVRSTRPNSKKCQRKNIEYLNIKNQRERENQEEWRKHNENCCMYEYADAIQFLGRMYLNIRSRKLYTLWRFLKSSKKENSNSTLVLFFAFIHGNLLLLLCIFNSTRGIHTYTKSHHDTHNADAEEDHSKQ